jgi:hypothetical protein
MTGTPPVGIQFPTATIDPKTGFVICPPGQFELPAQQCTDAVRTATNLRLEAFRKCREAQREKFQRDADAAAAWVLFAAATSAAIAAGAVGGFFGWIVAAFLIALAGSALSAAVVFSVSAYQEQRQMENLLLEFDGTVRQFEVEAALTSQICCPGNPPFDLTIPQCMLS